MNEQAAQVGKYHKVLTIKKNKQKREQGNKQALVKKSWWEPEKLNEWTLIIPKVRAEPGFCFLFSNLENYNLGMGMQGKVD